MQQKQVRRGQARRGTDNVPEPQGPVSGSTSARRTTEEAACLLAAIDEVLGGR